MKIKKYLLRGMLGTVALLLILVIASLSFSTVQSSSTGVHQRLLIPVFGVTAKAKLFSGTGDAVVIPGLLDGPVVKRISDDEWTATWFCQDRIGQASGKLSKLEVECAGSRHKFFIPVRQEREPAVAAMPEKLLILSDIEGNIAFLDGALRKLGVVGADGDWAFGANQLVIAGDSVDRGRDVFAVLWRLHGLSAQAKKAGGRVQVVLGNHEQYLLRGNASRANSEHRYAVEQMGGAKNVFSADTIIGAWLREQPVLVKVGRVLITHGGVSPVVARQGLTVDQVNDAMRRYWQGSPLSPAELDAVLGNSGVAQYRGYVMEVEGQYAKATQQDVDQALRAFGVDTIVVGHTIVEKVTGLYGNKVYAIDVNSNTAAPEALMFVNGAASVVDTGTPRALPEEGDEKLVSRRFRLFDSADWRMLGRMVQRTYQLSRLPHPY